MKSALFSFYLLHSVTIKYFVFVLTLLLIHLGLCLIFPVCYQTVNPSGARHGNWQRVKKARLIAYFDCACVASLQHTNQCSPAK